MDDCACLYGGYDDDYDESGFQVVAARTARKTHVCCECLQPIERGQKYQYFSAKHDGAIFTAKTCAICAEIRDALYCDGYTFGRLWSDTRTQLFAEHGLSVKCIDKLQTVEAKRVLQQRYIEFLGVQ